MDGWTDSVEFEGAIYIFLYIYIYIEMARQNTPYSVVCVKEASVSQTLASMARRWLKIIQKGVQGSSRVIVYIIYDLPYVPM
jgi:hypothetical protein